MKIIAIIALAAACIAGHATPALACDSECQRDRQEERDYRDRQESRERQRDLDRTLERQLRQMERDEREQRRDPSICQPGEDCRRTLWRSRR